MRGLRFVLLLAPVFACGGNGCEGAGILFKLLPEMGTCNPGGSTATMISIVDARADEELFVSPGDLPGGVTAAWQSNIEMRSQGTMTFNCSSGAALGQYDVLLSPYVVSMEGKIFDPLKFLLGIQ